MADRGTDSWKDVKTDAVKVVQVLEDDFRHDLAAHLYAVFLLHLKDPTTPKPSFTSWPLSWEQVPDPKVPLVYTDEDDVNTSSRRKNVVLDGASEELTDPLESLKAEITAVFRRKVYAKIHECNLDIEVQQRKRRKTRMGVQKGVEPIVEPTLELGEELFYGIKNKIDELIDGIYERKSTLRRKYAIRLNWRDIMLRLHADENTELIEARLRKMFEVNIRRDFFLELDDDKQLEVSRRNRIAELKEAVLEQRKRGGR